MARYLVLDVEAIKLAILGWPSHCWMDQGTQFQIPDPDRYESDILTHGMPKTKATGGRRREKKEKKRKKKEERRREDEGGRGDIPFWQ